MSQTENTGATAPKVTTEKGEEGRFMVDTMRGHLEGLQSIICAGIEATELEGATALGKSADAATFSTQVFADERGTARPRVLSDGVMIEKAAVNFTHSIGQHLPPAATERKPELIGSGFQAVSMSLIVHPRNPHAPTCHANFRFFMAERDGETTAWWFGGGYDLTPYFPVMEDVVHWHQTAKNSCGPDGDEVYSTFKSKCDEYFFLPHRKETRGVGGLFFDDWDTDGFQKSFDLVKSISDKFMDAYLPILKRRMHDPVTPWQRKFQCIRRGRYAEFNLLYDRGTRYGLQSGRRIDSVLASMPPEAHWVYPEEDKKSEEFRLAEQNLLDYLRPREWLTESVAAAPESQKDDDVLQ